VAFAVKEYSCAGPQTPRDFGESDRNAKQWVTFDNSGISAMVIKGKYDTFSGRMGVPRAGVVRFMAGPWGKDCWKTSQPKRGVLRWPPSLRNSRSD